MASIKNILIQTAWKNVRINHALGNKKAVAFWLKEYNKLIKIKNEK